MGLISIAATEVAAKGRHALMRESLGSFCENLLTIRGNVPMYLNIDSPYAFDQEFFNERSQMLAVATDFSERVVFNTGTGNFAKAFRWSMSQATTPYTLRLELDWVMTDTIPIQSLIDELESDPSLACVSLRAYNGINDSRICLAPGLWRTEAAKEIAARMVDDVNPEFQLRPNPWLGQYNPHCNKQGHWKGKQFPDHVVIRDLGRSWMEQNGYVKEARNNFNRWVNVGH